MSAAARKGVAVADLLAALRSYKFRYSCEKDLQDGIAKALLSKSIPFVREKKIGARRDTIDFLVDGRIGLEVKIKGSPTAVAKQLLGYAGCPEVEEILLVTGRARLGRLPATLGGKRLHVLPLWSSFL